MTNSTNSNAKLHEALELIGAAAKDKQSEIHDLLFDKYKDVRAAVTQVEKDFIKREQALVRESRERAARMATAVDRRVHKDPWPVLGWVCGGSFLLGYLFGRKA